MVPIDSALSHQEVRSPHSLVGALFYVATVFDKG